MLYLSHKAVHAEFIPAERHRDRYQSETFVAPRTMDPASVEGAPMWVKNQRNSWHGVGFPYHSTLDVGDYYKRYAETMPAVDEGLGQIIDLLKAKGWLDATLIIFMVPNSSLHSSTDYKDFLCVICGWAAEKKDFCASSEIFGTRPGASLAGSPCCA